MIDDFVMMHMVTYLLERKKMREMHRERKSERERMIIRDGGGGGGE